jgi:hypothetical protein
MAARIAPVVLDVGALAGGLEQAAEVTTEGAQAMKHRKRE